MSPFEQELRRLGTRRIRLAELRDAYFRAHRETLDAPDARRLLHDALCELKDDGAVELPARGWDESGSPPIPRTVLLRNVERKGTKRAAQAWLPALAFAADERNPARRTTLEAINAFLIARRGEKLHPVPARERSLHIFGDEKRLDTLRKSKTTLLEGRISLADLSCYAVDPPLPVERDPRHTPGRPILVLENYHSYESFRRWNQTARQYAAIAFGGGNAFRRGAGNLDEIITSTQASGAVYIGDLDPRGVEILLGVNDQRVSTGRSAIPPHRGLYRWLLANGCRGELKNTPRRDMLAKVWQRFPVDLVHDIMELWETGLRIPQESFGLEQLSGTDEGVARADAA